jgi:hypothetical protein
VKDKFKSQFNPKEDRNPICTGILERGVTGVVTPKLGTKKSCLIELDKLIE